MASLPPIRRIAFEDIANAPSWVKGLLQPLNQFTESVYLALNRQLTINENLRATIKTIAFSTPANYWAPGGFGSYEATTDNKVAGAVFLVAGTVTVTTPAVPATPLIVLTRLSNGAAPGFLGQGVITAGTSFVINSSAGADDGLVAWLIVNPLHPEFTPVRFQSGLPVGVRVQGVFPLSITQSDGTPVVLPASIPSWTEPANGTVQIDMVTGLKASTNYVGTFLVV